MNMDIVARALRGHAGLDEGNVVSAMTLARRLGVDVRRVDAGLLRGGDSCLVWIRGEPVIYVRRGLTPEALQWLVAHELGELGLFRAGYRGEDVEQLADAAAAAILMPRAAFREAAFERREDLVGLALDFACSQTATAMRLAETRVAEVVVVVCSSRIYARSADEFALPNEAAIRRGTLASMPGVRSVRLSDARRRVAYIAA